MKKKRKHRQALPAKGQESGSTLPRTVAYPPGKPEPPLGYPIGEEGSDASAFIKRAAELLDDPLTSIYVDTSFLMWLTKGGADSRQQFIAWAQSAGKRVHVPVWTYHEYYRHNTRDTLRSDLSAEAKKLKDATRQYIAIAQTYADNSFKTGFSDESFARELKELDAKVKSVTDTAGQWDYPSAAKQLRDWMSERLCRSKVVFDLMDRIGQSGEARYTQDVPPGYLDRIKADSPEKGSNKFGDLIMWEEVLSHVNGNGVGNVVLLTRDRKLDWFAPAGEPTLDGDLERLGARWNPVPAPHPTLVLELRERTQAKELMLLDSLYLGAILHHGGGLTHSRLISYSLGVSSAGYMALAQNTQGGEVAEGRATGVRPQRVSEPISIGQARSVCQLALVPVEPDQRSRPVAERLAELQGELPAVEASIAAFTHETLARLSVEDAAVFARIVADQALAEGGLLARAMANRLLGLLPQANADVAAGVYAGFLSSSYFDGSVPRLAPKAWDLQALFDQLGDPAYAGVLKCFGRSLSAAGSEAMFIPSSPLERLTLRFAHDTSQEQIPMVLQQISVGSQNLLTEVGRALPENLFEIVGRRGVVSADDLLKVAADRFGLPLKLIDLTGAQEEFTLPETIGFIPAGDTQTISEMTDVLTDAELEAIPEDQLEVPDEESLDAIAFLDEDPDDQ